MEESNFNLDFSSPALTHIISNFQLNVESFKAVQWLRLKGSREVNVNPGSRTFCLTPATVLPI